MSYLDYGFVIWSHCNFDRLPTSAFFFEAVLLQMSIDRCIKWPFYDLWWATLHTGKICWYCVWLIVSHATSLSLCWLYVVQCWLWCIVFPFFWYSGEYEALIGVFMSAAVIWLAGAVSITSPSYRFVSLRRLHHEWTRLLYSSLWSCCCNQVGNLVCPIHKCLLW